MFSPFSNSSSVHTFNTKSIVSLKHHRSLEEKILTLTQFRTDSLLAQICFKTWAWEIAKDMGTSLTLVAGKKQNTGTRLVVLLCSWSVIYNSVLMKVFKMLSYQKLVSSMVDTSITGNTSEVGKNSPYLFCLWKKPISLKHCIEGKQNCIINSKV